MNTHVTNKLRELAGTLVDLKGRVRIALAGELAPRWPSLLVVSAWRQAVFRSDQATRNYPLRYA